LRGRNQHTPARGTPRVDWQIRLLTIKVPDGGATTTSVRLKVRGRPVPVNAVVGGQLKGIITVGLDRLIPLGNDHYELPIDVTLPAKARKGYTGSIVLRHGRRELGRPLPVTVVVTKPPAGKVPATATSPSPQRVVTEGGTKFVGDELVLLVDEGAADPDAVALAAAKAAGGAVNGAVPATRTYQIRFSGLAATGLGGKATLLRAVAGVEAVSRNFVTTEALVAPNDTEWDAWGGTPAGNNANFEYTGMPDAVGCHHRQQRHPDGADRPGHGPGPQRPRRQHRPDRRPRRIGRGTRYAHGRHHLC
jgi:hypothetical protein